MPSSPAHTSIRSRLDRHRARPTIGRIATDVSAQATALPMAKSSPIVDVDQLRQIEPAQMREDGVDILAGGTFGREQANIGGRMTGENANELGARIPAGAQNADANAIITQSHEPSLPNG